MHSEFLDIIKHYPEVTGIHPACLAVPPINDDDKAILETSIRENGLRHEILLTTDGMLIDGRNRLIACYKGQIEARFRKVSIDPWQVAYAENIARRHLDTGQKAIFGLEWRDHEREAAKERQGTRNDLNGTSGKHVPEVERSRDKAGERVGVSGKAIDKAAKIAEAAPDVLEQVRDGSKSLEEGYREARQRDKQSQQQCADSPHVTGDDLADIVTAKGIASKIKLPKKVVFNRTTDSVDWAAWTWNPITGCEHGCGFCYAREIALSQRMADYYPNGFEPTFHEYRLAAPQNTKRPASDDPRDGRVFVCSMADLFGKWVPKAWINAVFEACLASPEWEYLFLTKWPARYSQMPLISRAWYGASVIQQSDVSRVEAAMQKIETDEVVCWVSLEPMLGPIKFDDLSWCDLMVIGSQTTTNQPGGVVPAFAPQFDWVVDVVNQCRAAGVPYYLKANLADNPGMSLPKSLPRRS